MLVTVIGMVLLYVILGAAMIKLGRGYNSLSRAMASVEAQNFAARYFGKRFIVFSLILGVPAIVLSVIAFVLGSDGEMHSAVFWIQMALVIAPPLIAIIMTEVKLRRHFDKNGRPYR